MTGGNQQKHLKDTQSAASLAHVLYVCAPHHMMAVQHGAQCMVAAPKFHHPGSYFGVYWAARVMTLISGMHVQHASHTPSNRNTECVPVQPRITAMHPCMLHCLAFEHCLPATFCLVSG